MDAEPERQMALGVARDVEAVGMRELRFVAVGRAEQRDHHRTRRNPDTAELDVLCRLAEQQLDRPVVTQRDQSTDVQVQALTADIVR